MGVYEEFGVRRIISVSGTSTRLGGSLMPREVVEAMSEAAEDSVNLVELQAAASRVIARVTGAEAGYIGSGASSCLTLGAAAIIAGLDPALMERLPDTQGMKNEFIVARDHRNGYDHAMRVAGARFVEVGMNEHVAGSGVRRNELWEYEAAIGDRTAAIAYTALPGSQPPLDEVVGLAHRHDLPVIVDAAGQLPPLSNLRKFIEIGVDLVAFSGGKAIRGPQGSGILCGRKEYIASAAIQHLDNDEYFDIWDPPEDLIPKSAIVGIPRQGLGRGFKVSKEEIIGLLTALQLFAEDVYERYDDKERKYLELIADGLSDLPADPQIVTSNMDHGGQKSDKLHIVLNAKKLGKSGFGVSQELKRGDPGVFVNEMLLHENTLIIDPMNLDQGRAEALTSRLKSVLSGAKD